MPFIQEVNGRLRCFLPLNIVFCNVAPALLAYGEAPVSVIDVDCNIRVFAFSVPGIFAVFNQFTSWAFHGESNQLVVG
jgi:hypothetical protein